MQDHYKFKAYYHNGTEQEISVLAFTVTHAWYMAMEKVNVPHGTPLHGIHLKEYPKQ